MNSFSRLISYLIAAGLVAGTLDILCAFAWVYLASGTSPAVVLKYIASALFGPGTAFSGGQVMIVWGLLIHFAIAFLWTACIFVTYAKVGFLRESFVFSTVLSGIVIWLTMNLAVLPLSQVPPSKTSVQGVSVGIFILIIAVSSPGYYFARRAFQKS